MSEPGYDLAVVGGGLAGLVGALRAAELGARVALFETGAEHKYAANSRFTGGVFHVAFQDILAPPEVLEEAILAATGGFADPALARALAQDAGRAVAWLAEQGADYGVGGPLPFMGHMLKPFSLREPGFARHWPERGADRLLAELERRLLARGGRFFRATRARRLNMVSGRCRGLEVEHADGSRRAVEASAVLLADGGFQGDRERVRQHLSPRPESLCTRGAGTGVGDGLAMAEAVGAKTLHLDRFYGHVQCAEALTDERFWPYPILDIVASAAIVVDARGQRFTDEGLGGVALANAIAALEDPLSAFVIMDEPLWNRAGKEFLLPPNPYIERLGVAVHRAPSLALLAEGLGMPAATLSKTVDDYNAALVTSRGACLRPPRSGQGSTLARAPAMITTQPFMAIRLCAGITYTMGGIAIDAHGRVLDRHEAAIPGLFAAGSTTAGLEGGPNSGYVGGLAKALVFGLRAAERAVEESARRG
ncbi:FAD-binding protein [Pseudomonas sp. RIT-PI-AD]|uniref:FAD-dependent oxidoreductase n=1 Tax=Pseudomonas sp. RIT-PI-AD TaxID=3035294 RepID=UPI0021DA1F6E|nr:FAD-binding protein [Pseudomonas sp. RIT-PI-AD]